ncbi:MAG: hypothetical protein ACRC0E_04865 [Soonwooa sp.]
MKNIFLTENGGGKQVFFKGIEVDTWQDYDDKMELIERREK